MSDQLTWSLINSKVILRYGKKCVQNFLFFAEMAAVDLNGFYLKVKI